MTKVRKRNGEYRVVESETLRIAKSKHGKAMDGGGHDSKAKALRQAEHINANPRRTDQ